ncbi:MAG: hypothetical protein AB8B59_01765 [Maribacter sp.]
MDENTHSVQLVEGTFLPVDAADILFSLISAKIKFHQLQMLSLQEPINDYKGHSEHPIEALKHSKTDIKDLILKARDEGYKLKIDSKINIELIKISRQA